MRADPCTDGSGGGAEGKWKEHPRRGRRLETLDNRRVSFLLRGTRAFSGSCRAFPGGPGATMCSDPNQRVTQPGGSTRAAAGVRLERKPWLCRPKTRRLRSIPPSYPGRVPGAVPKTGRGSDARGRSGRDRDRPSRTGESSREPGVEGGRTFLLSLESMLLPRFPSDPRSLSIRPRSPSCDAKDRRYS